MNERFRIALICYFLAFFVAIPKTCVIFEVVLTCQVTGRLLLHFLIRPLAIVRQCEAV